MKEVEEKLKEFLLKSLELAEETGKFVMDQAPELLEEFYRWHTIEHSIESVLFLFPLIVFLKTYKTANFDDVDAKAGVCIFSGAVLVFLSVVSISGIFDLIKITVAPKLYLIDFFL